MHVRPCSAVSVSDTAAWQCRTHHRSFSGGRLLHQDGASGAVPGAVGSYFLEPELEPLVLLLPVEVMPLLPVVPLLSLEPLEPEPLPPWPCPLLRLLRQVLNSSENFLYLSCRHE